MWVPFTAIRAVKDQENLDLVPCLLSLPPSLSPVSSVSCLLFLESELAGAHLRSESVDSTAKAALFQLGVDPKKPRLLR
jgi:hypothetical protein